MNDAVDWIVIIYSLPSKPTAHRVRTWKTLKRIGAISLKSSVYILPFNEDLYERVLWLKQDIQKNKGEITLLKVDKIENMSQQEIRALFNQAREKDYQEILVKSWILLDDLNKIPSDRIIDGIRECQDSYKLLKKRTAEAKAIDYFQSPKASEVYGLLDDIAEKLEQLKVRSFEKHGIQSKSWSAEEVRGKTWVTRPGPHIDRIASAWLIKRFIDHDAKFIFAAADDMPRDSIRFDTVGADLSHHGEDCTFETVIKRFGIRKKVLMEIAEIVHDIDLMDGKFSRQEAQGLDSVIRGLAKIYTDDHRLLEKGGEILEAVYLSLGGR